MMRTILSKWQRLHRARIDRGRIVVCQPVVVFKVTSVAARNHNCVSRQQMQHHQLCYYSLTCIDRPLMCARHFSARAG